MAGFDPTAKEVLSAVPGALRALRAQNNELLTKLAAYDRRHLAEETG